MNVLATRRQELGHPSVDRLYPAEKLRDVIGEADVVSLHLRLDDTTRGLIDRSMIAAMKRGALLINTARGAIIDEPAMIEALTSGHLGGVYLDVFATEPLPPSSPLWTLPNVLITPHAADNSIGWAPRFAQLFADNLDRLMRGEKLVNELDRLS
jgi:phosphoglycerate dehydrogenase-like enzyme